MNVFQIIVGSVMILSAIAIILIVLFQQGRSAGLSGAIAGGAESFLGKNKSRTVEAKLVKITKILAIVFFVISLGVSITLVFIK